MCVYCIVGNLVNWLLQVLAKKCNSYIHLLKCLPAKLNFMPLRAVWAQLHLRSWAKTELSSSLTDNIIMWLALWKTSMLTYFIQFHTNNCKIPIVLLLSSISLHQNVARSFNHWWGNVYNISFSSYRVMRFQISKIGQNLHTNMEGFAETVTYRHVATLIIVATSYFFVASIEATAACE